MRSKPNTRRRRGMTIVELLVASTITAAVFVAVGWATHAAARSYGANLARAETSSRARATLERLANEIRVTREHAPLSSSAVAAFTGGRIVEDSGLTLYDADGALVEWAYDADGATLVLRQGGGEYVALRGVQSFRVTFEPMRSALSVRGGGGHDLLKRATILLSVSLDGPRAGVDAASVEEAFTLSTSVVPRRNAW